MATILSQKCTACRKVMGNLVKAHTLERCPMQKALYCGLCAIYGHSPDDCPDIGAAAFREPEFMEQLVPASLLAEFNITSRTPLNVKRIPDFTVHQKIVQVAETEDAIRAALVSYGEKPMICQGKGKREKRELIENKKKLQKIMTAAGKRLIFVKEDCAVVASTL
jgi:hypothetical protein